MRKLALSSLILFIAFFAASRYALFVYAPGIIQIKTTQAFAQLGIETTALGTPDIRHQSIRYNNLKLDPQGLSTADTLKIRYNPITLLAFGRIDSATLSGLRLTGDLLEGNKLRIAGWKNSTLNKLNTQFNLRKLEIEKARLSLLTLDLGGITLNYDAQLSKRNDVIELQARFSSAQKRLGFTANLSGHISSIGLWQGLAEIEQAKFDLPSIKASRINGQIKITSATHTGITLLSDFEAGGLSLGDFSWQNASGSFEGTPEDYKVFIDAKSVGRSGVELSLGLEKSAITPPAVSGSLHAENLGLLLSYLQTQGVLDESAEIAPAFMKTPPVEAKFALTNPEGSADKTLSFRINNEEKNFDINGQSKFSSSKEYTGNLTSSPIFLSTLDAGLFSEGHFTFSGDFDTKGAAFTGNLKAEVKDATYKAGPLKISNIAGDIIFKDALSLSTETTQALRCDLSGPIRHQCTLNVSLSGGALNFESLALKLWDGKLSVKNFNPLLENDDKWTLETKNINLWKLSQALNFEGVTGTGTLEATLPIVKKDGRLFLQRGVIKNKGKGVFRYLYNNAPNFFEGDELELETIRMALQNYHFDYLEIRLSGPLDGELNALIIGSGTNPALLGTRKITLHLKTNTTLAKLLEHIDGNTP